MRGRRKKWATICEIVDGLAEDSTIPRKVGEHLTLVGQAVHLGYRSWLFKYKDVYVVLYDSGNSHFSFYMPGTLFDAGLVKLRKLFESRRRGTGMTSFLRGYVPDYLKGYR